METDMKIEALVALTAAAQHLESIGTTRLQGFVKSLTVQGLLAEAPSCTPQQRVKWTKAAHELLTIFSRQMSSAQVSICQSACCLAAASLRSCSASMFVEYYNAVTVTALDLIRKQTSALPNSPRMDHMWTVVAAAFTRYAPCRPDVLCYRIEQLVHLLGLRREASSLAAKLMAVLQPILAHTGLLPLASIQDVSSVSIDLLQGLNAGLQALPTAFRAHQKALGQFAATLLALPMLSAAARSEAARTFSLLPRLTGDAETWSSYTQDILVASHNRLDVAYLGMDDPALAASAKAALTTDAQPLAALLQDLTSVQHSMASQRSRSAGQSVHSVAAVEAALGQLAGCLDALERLLTSSFPVAVPLPAHGALMLLTRILSFDASVRQAGQVPPSASAYLTLSAALPALHCCALHLVQTLLWTGQGSLLLHYAAMARVMASLLRNIAAAPDLEHAPAAALLRQQVYKTSSELVGRGGLGVAVLLAPQAVPCALLELYGGKQSKKRPLEQGLPNGHPPKKQKKSKKDDELPSLESMMDGSGVSGMSGAAAQQSSNSSLDSSSAGAQEAALQLLQSLLQSWGSGMSQQQRLQIDAVTAHIASTSSLALHRVSQSFEGSCNQAGANAVQLAAMKALLASMLSPAPHRPPFLPQALALFTQGLQSPAPDIVHFSQQTLLALEGIIHPRAGHTILQPHRPSTQSHPYLSASTAELAELGMPRVWSALLPDACRPAQKMLTAADATEVQAKAAIRAVAQEVVRAGHVCSAAVAKLQATLDGSDTGNTVQIAEHVAEHHAQGYVAVEPLGGHDAAAAAATEAAVPAATLERSVDIHMGSVDTPVGSLDARPQLTSNGGQDHIVSASHALKSSVEQDSHPASLPGFVPQSGHQINASDVAFANETDDRYIGLENQSAVIAADTDVPRTVAGYVAAAESSDSQGSLPEIDSGEYSDSSSDQ